VNSEKKKRGASEVHPTQKRGEVYPAKIKKKKKSGEVGPK
jgi:hypothetical protein